LNEEHNIYINFMKIGPLLETEVLRGGERSLTNTALNTESNREGPRAPYIFVPLERTITIGGEMGVRVYCVPPQRDDQ
jgi:hypothetical protein